MKWFDKILKFFGLCRYKNYYKLHTITDDLRDVNTTLQIRIKSTEFKTLEEYKTNQELLDNKNKKLEAELKVQTEFYKQIQTLLSEKLIDFGKLSFPKSLMIPGSVDSRIDQADPCVLDPVDIKDSYTKYTGRIIFDDVTTTKIKNEIAINKKVDIIAKYMSQYGITDMIITKLIKNGNIPIVLGYRDSNTVYEAYFTISLMNGTTIIAINE